MPCYDERGSGNVREVRVTPQEYRHNSPVAEILCSLCTALAKAGVIGNYLDRDGRIWWTEHQARDARKRKK